MTSAYDLGRWVNRILRRMPQTFGGALALLLLGAVIGAGIVVLTSKTSDQRAAIPQSGPTQADIDKAAADRQAEAEREQEALRERERARFETKHAAEAYLVGVHRVDPDARLVNLRETGDGWAGCLSTARPVDGFTGLPVEEEGAPGGRCVCSR